jgi:WD40 repeat protein/serine/threonine protein kinase
MNAFAPVDDALLQRLPLPLAQLLRRAHNAHAPLERHLAAFRCWEAALKLLAMAAVVAYARRNTPDAALTEPLHNLARPALGHWWEFVRLLVPWLAERGEEPYARLLDQLLGPTRGDLPRAAGLDAALRAELEGKGGARTTVRLADLFDRLLEYRGKRLGHGAVEGLTAETHRRQGAALLSGAAEFLDRVDVLAGRRLVYVGEVSQSGGVWLAERYDLTGEPPRRIASLELPREEVARLPDGERLYLAEPDATGPDGLTPLHPLLIYDADTEEVLFLNARRGSRRTEYLGHSTGRTPRREDQGSVALPLLAEVLGWDGKPPAGADPASPGHEAPADEEPAARELGEFALGDELGRGGMGVVYRARQPSLDRQVALKKLLRTGDRKAEARFAREIRALGRVDHPNVVKVYTSGSDGDQWFYAMELIEGPDLAAVYARLANSTAAEVTEDDWTTAVSVAREGQRKQETPAGQEGAAAPAPPAVAPRRAGKAHIAQVVELVRQVAEAAQALHEAGVLHRDIKPGNIMLSAEDGHAVLMDLGLAQLLDDAEGRLTRTHFVGTPRYASPEQIESAKLDARADVYSLGATLWELLTLRPLYGVTDQTPTPDVMLKIRTTDPERVRKHNPRVPRDLEAIVMKCLEKDRARRYTSAGDLAADLGRWQRGDAVLAQPPSLRYLLGKQLWRWRVPLTVAAGVLLAAVVGVVVAFVQINDALEREKAARGVAETKEKETNEALGREKELAAKQKALLSEAARLHLAMSVREFQNGYARHSLYWLLRAYETAPEDDPLRLSYLRLLTGKGQLLPRSTFVHGNLVNAVALSPDGRTALTACWDKTARLWDLASGKQIAELQHHGRVAAVAFSPDGRTALTGGEDSKARLWDLASGKQVAELPHERTVWSVAFSPDGRTTLTGGNDGMAQLWDLASGKRIAVLRHGGAVTSVAFSPDGRTALTGGDFMEGRARLWDLASGAQVAELLHGGAVSSVAFSPDGRTALTGGNDGTARLWNLASRKQVAELPHGGAVSSVAYSPDGRTALTGGNDAMAQLWDLASGKRIAVLRHGGAGMSVAFSPDGRTALTGGWDGTAQLWSLAWGKETVDLRHGKVGRVVALSPDGRAALTGGYGGRKSTAGVWDLTSGKLVAELRHGGRMLALAVSPDGHTALTGDAHGEAQLWDLPSGEPIGALRHGGGEVWLVAFSPDGRTALTCSDDDTARLWDLASVKMWGILRTEKQFAMLRHGNTLRAVALSPDGRTALTGGEDGVARLWDIASGKQVAELRHRGRVHALGFSPDGRTALTGDESGAGRLWDLASRKQIAELRHYHAVRAVAFSPDGRTALTGDDNGEAWLWDLASGEWIAWLPHGNPLRAVGFTSDGWTALTGDTEGRARLWSVPLSAPDEPARVRAWVRVRTAKRFDDQGVLREMTHAEWIEACHELKANGGDWQQGIASRDWHLAAATDAESAGEWYAAAFHFRKLLTEESDNVEYLERLGTALYRDGRFAEVIERLSETVQKHGQGKATAARLLLAMARRRLGQQFAAVSAAGLPATPHGGPLLTAWPLLAHYVVARKQLADAIRRIEETMSPDQQKDQRWQQLRKEAEALLNR